MDIIDFLEKQYFEDLLSVFNLAGINTESAISAFIDDFPTDDVITIGNNLKENETFELKDFNDKLSKFTPLEISKMTKNLEYDFDLEPYKFLIKDHKVVSLDKIEYADYITSDLSNEYKKYIINNLSKFSEWYGNVGMLDYFDNNEIEKLVKDYNNNPNKYKNTILLKFTNAQNKVSFN